MNRHAVLQPGRWFLVSALAAICAALQGCVATPQRRPPLPEATVQTDTLPPLRRLVLVHEASKERLDVIYYRDGAYDRRAMAAISHLLRDRTTGATQPIDPALMDFLFDLLQRTGLAGALAPVHVLSAFRSPETNAALVKADVRAVRESFHMQGKALDIRIPMLPGAAIAEIAKTMQRGGAAYYPSSGHTHIDTGPIRTWAAR
jgi:uncharacterized protein YcbK (DUF882 family)